jgi:hypothetical protein
MGIEIESAVGGVKTVVSDQWSVASKTSAAANGLDFTDH